MTAKEHYQHHLAHFYEWMAGDFETKQKEQQDYFEDRGIKPLSGGLALDLGAGHGLQSVSLARIGFRVKAGDFNTILLDSLRRNGNGLEIEITEADLLNERNFAQPAELVVCMGDTIAHLKSEEEIAVLLKRSFDGLEEKGKLILSFRDYGTELVDEERFIPVKSDESKILTCFLEYFKDKVRVTDILHEKIDGAWKQRVGSYYKVRVTASRMEQLVATAGFKIISKEIITRMNFLIAEKIKLID